jgi:hypothetical protein
MFFGFGLFLSLVIIIVGLGFYFIPTIIAVARNHKNKIGIFLLNLLAGWTFLGWVGALIWSVITLSGVGTRAF